MVYGDEIIYVDMECDLISWKIVWGIILFSLPRKMDLKLLNEAWLGGL